MLAHPTAEPPLVALAQPLLARCDPSASALLDWLRPQIDDSLLEVIARADHDWQVEQYLLHLRRLRDDGDLDPKHVNQALEVLKLASWSEPDHPGAQLHGRSGHLLRAFCCAVLLGAAAEPDLPNRDFVSGENQTIIQLIASTLVLGRLAAQRLCRPGTRQAVALERGAQPDQQPPCHW